ncbi:hypothetical protein RVR_8823 [Actinacidiphila reveromycinica]|uniref:Uncharacterized protein n=1 Tax=Actinacidiphila reveromycinica TaxID=659352 RepID=A0A7U3UZ06_9ACTN|nr:hypothetical protein RVR_8823 [Streptomyces sp. SN-593]
MSRCPRAQPAHRGHRHAGSGPETAAGTVRDSGRKTGRANAQDRQTPETLKAIGKPGRSW